MPKVVSIVTDEELEQRRRLGLDRFDEIWDGVLHMAPPPDSEHQEFGGILESLLRRFARDDHPDAYVAHEVAVADPARWPEDYRTPDLVVCLDRADVAPKFVVRADLAVEIRSPEDETFDKFPFYARRGVAEILVVDRQGRGVELYRRRESQYVLVGADVQGWLTSEIGVQFRWDAAIGTLQVKRRGDGGPGEAVR